RGRTRIGWEGPRAPHPTARRARCRRRRRRSRPDPWPAYFGFHEVFHTFTVLAFASHYVAVSLATYSLR
ncbi:hemolysin III family protein, partial [Nocardioides sp.]|uniref:hemolysin III family protein n=1 Tax=Nocardioides sp. TaxID=35761 RepID=UPI0027521B9D|nr:hypothetical protein [Nocardioides sp.]